MHPLVGYAQPGGVASGRRVRVLRLGRVRVVERAVVVEVPRVRERKAFRVGRAAAVEVHLERRRPARRVRVGDAEGG